MIIHDVYMFVFIILRVNTIDGCRGHSGSHQRIEEWCANKPKFKMPKGNVYKYKIGYADDG